MPGPVQRYRGLALSLGGIALAIFGLVVVQLGIRQATSALALGGLEVFGTVLAGIGALTSLFAAFLVRE